MWVVQFRIKINCQGIPQKSQQSTCAMEPGRTCESYGHVFYDFKRVAPSGYATRYNKSAR